MFKTWALILMVSTADGQKPIEKARYESLEQCMMQSTLAMQLAPNKEEYLKIARFGFCRRNSTGEMYHVWDYVVRELNICRRNGMCDYTVKPKSTKREPAIDLTHRNSSRYVYAN